MISSPSDSSIKSDSDDSSKVYGCFVYLEDGEITFVAGERHRIKALPAFTGTVKQRLEATKNYYTRVTYLYNIFHDFMCDKFESVAKTPGNVEKLIQRDTLPCYKEFLIMCRDNAPESKKLAGRKKVKEAVDKIKRQLNDHFFIFSKGTLDRPIEAPGRMIIYLYYERYRCLAYMKELTYQLESKKYDNIVIITGN
jgi:hypothetical protein